MRSASPGINVHHNGLSQGSTSLTCSYLDVVCARALEPSAVGPMARV